MTDRKRLPQVFSSQKKWSNICSWNKKRSSLWLLLNRLEKLKSFLFMLISLTCFYIHFIYQSFYIPSYIPKYWKEDTLSMNVPSDMGIFRWSELCKRTFESWILLCSHLKPILDHSKCTAVTEMLLEVLHLPCTAGADVEMIGSSPHKFNLNIFT